jgi:pimeloyl-ACP methyl ester carboxylesterase
MASEPEMAVERMKIWLRNLRDSRRTSRPLTTMQEAIERLALHHPNVPRAVIETRAELLTRLDNQGQLIWAYDPLHRTTAPTPFNIESFRVFLRRIECPTMVVSGGPFGWHPVDEAERATCLRDVRHLELPTAGHMMHWTSPEALAASLLEFFAEPPPPPRD